MQAGAQALGSSSARAPHSPTAAQHSTAQWQAAQYSGTEAVSMRTLRPTMVWNRPVPLLEPGKELFLSICCVISP